MTTTSVATGTSPAPLNLPGRFLGIIVSPQATFRTVVAHPRWLGMLALVTIVTAICAALPMTTQEGKEAVLRSQVEGMESFGMTVTDQQYEAMRRAMGTAPCTTAGAVLAGGPLMTLVAAGILFVVFNVVMGGDTSFRQLFAVVVHAGVISTLGQLFTGPINYLRGEVSSASNLAALLPMIDPKSFAGRVLSMTDIFLIWYVLVLAIGLGVLSRRRTTPIAASLYAVYAVIVLAAAAVMTRLGGS